MTIIESLTIILASFYLITYSYKTYKNKGILISVVLIVAGFALAHSPLLWGLTGSCLIAILALGFILKKYKYSFNSFKINDIRFFAQSAFLLSIFLIAIEYTINTWQLLHGINPTVAKPNIVDAFLPILGGMEIRAVVGFGETDIIMDHPASFIMLCTVILSGIFTKRAFCGWACPIGFIGDLLYSFRKKFIKKDFSPPKWLDWILRSLKYVVLSLLLFITFSVPLQSLPNYFQANYNKITDVKMAYLFVHPNTIALIAFLVLFILVIWRRQSFCRYLCPYGALLGITSVLSPIKIKRSTLNCLNEQDGLHCSKCTRACPANIQVHSSITVRTDECQSCMRCVAACPKEDALNLSFANRKSIKPNALLSILMIFLFVIPFVAYLFGVWNSSTPTEIRQELIQQIEHVNH